MSLTGKTKATGYGVTGLGLGGIGGLAGVASVSRIGFDDIETMLDGTARGLQEGYELATDNDYGDKTEIDVNDGFFSSMASAALYGVIAAGSVYGASKSFQYAKSNW